jgi:hypothetical protein
MWRLTTKTMPNLIEFDLCERNNGAWYPTGEKIAVNADFIISIRQRSDGVTSIQMKGQHPTATHSVFSDSHSVAVLDDFEMVMEKYYSQILRPDHDTHRG